METIDFKGKVALITGSSSGIGAACVQAFEACGARVARMDWKDDPSPDFFRADVSRAAEVEAAVRAVAERFGGVDILVHNAGIQRYGTPVTVSEEEWDEVLAVNLKGAFLVSKYVLPLMLGRGGGSLVFTGSVQSVTAQRNSVHYVTSKHALLGLTRSIALDFGERGIRANCLMPGAIDTPMLRWAANLDPDPERVLEGCARLHIRNTLGEAAEVARVAVFLSSDWASFITGAAIPVDGGMTVPTGGMASQATGMGSSKG